ncbi:MAG: hypothetical protein RLZZ337_611 [Bacteroidota bacterium]
MQEDNTLLREIAEQIDLGQICYFNKKTKQHFFIPSQVEDDAEFYQEAIQRKKDEKKELIEIKAFDSKTAFLLMEEFVQGIDDFEVQSSFMEALYNERPFANFKQKARQHRVEKEWSAFRVERLSKSVSDSIGSYL